MMIERVAQVHVAVTDIQYGKNSKLRTLITHWEAPKMHRDSMNLMQIADLKLLGTISMHGSNINKS